VPNAVQENLLFCVVTFTDSFCRSQLPK